MQIDGSNVTHFNS